TVPAIRIWKRAPWNAFFELWSTGLDRGQARLDACSIVNALLRGHQGLRKPGETLAPDVGAREVVAELALREELEREPVLGRGVRVRSLSISQPPASADRETGPEGKHREEGEDEDRVDREVTVGCLHPPMVAATSHHLRQAEAHLVPSDGSDHRVADDQVEPL